MIRVVIEEWPNGSEGERREAANMTIIGDHWRLFDNGDFCGAATHGEGALPCLKHAETPLETAIRALTAYQSRERG